MRTLCQRVPVVDRVLWRQGRRLRNAFQAGRGHVGWPGTRNATRTHGLLLPTSFLLTPSAHYRTKKRYSKAEAYGNIVVFHALRRLGKNVIQ